MKKAAIIICIWIVTLLVGNVVYAQDDSSDASARVRIVNGVLDGPVMDIFANDAVIVAELSFTAASPFVTLPPGVANLTVTSAGAGPDESLLEPETLTLEADHDYVVVVAGLVEDENLQLLSIDLTAAFDGFESSDEHANMLLVNALNGVDAITATAADFEQAEALAFGEFVATSAPTKPYQHRIVVTERTLDVLLDQQIPEGLIPGTRNVLVLLGDYRGEYFDFYSITFVRDTPLNSIEFLQVLSDANLESLGTFESFLTAVTRAELTDKLSNEGPFIIAAPDDDAFAELPEGMLDDPGVLRDVLLYHVTDELIEAADESVTVTTLQGSTIDIVPGTLGVLVNNALLQTQLIGTHNGFVAIINEVLIPPEE